MIKLQTYDPSLGWLLVTRTVELPFAYMTLAVYRIDYPGQEHRLVEITEDGILTVVQEDAEEVAVWTDFYTALLKEDAN